MAERWFGELTTKNLQGGTHRSAQGWNDDPWPYVWTKTADQILDSVARYCTRTDAPRR